MRPKQRMLPTLVYVFTGYNVLKEGTGEELRTGYASDSTSPVEPTPSLRPHGV